MVVKDGFRAEKTRKRTVLREQEVKGRERRTQHKTVEDNTQNTQDRVLHSVGNSMPLPTNRQCSRPPQKCPSVQGVSGYGLVAVRHSLLQLPGTEVGGSSVVVQDRTPLDC
jgi:hypothetical protein